MFHTPTTTAQVDQFLALAGHVTVEINMLPDNVFLEIFDFYKDDPTSTAAEGYTWKWKTLIHVCRTWRHIILASPWRLELRLVFSERTPTTTLLDIWPPLPITIVHDPEDCYYKIDENGVENLIPAVEHHDRVAKIFILNISGPALEKLIAVMHQPLTALREFRIWSNDEAAPVLPETFLGGSASRLPIKSFFLEGIPFPALPKFISSATSIVNLDLLDIPDRGYISPEVMATCVATLSNLRRLSIRFRSPESRPLQSSPPPLTRATLPSLTGLSLGGAGKYIEAFVSQIDTPRLNRLIVDFFVGLDFDMPQLRDFINRTGNPRPFNQAQISHSDSLTKIILRRSSTPFQLDIRYKLDWGLSAISQMFSRQLPLLSHIERLEVVEPRWDDPVEGIEQEDPAEWLGLFHMFIAVQHLRVSRGLVPLFEAILEDAMEEMAMDVLPALRKLSLEGLEPQPSGSVPRAIELFVALRETSGRPVIIQSWKRPQTPEIEDYDFEFGLTYPDLD